MIKAVVFDMDGVLFDTEALSLVYWGEAGREFGVDITPETARRLIGYDTKDSDRILAERFGPRDWEAIRALRRELDDKYIRERGVPLKPGLFEALDFVKTLGLPMAVATSTSRQRAGNLLKRSGVMPYLSALACGDEVARGKPAPDVYLAACAKLGIAPCDCLAVEDSAAGLKSARAAGMAVAMIPDLIPPEDGAGCVVLEDLRGLKNYLKEDTL